MYTGAEQMVIGKKVMNIDEWTKGVMWACQQKVSAIRARLQDNVLLSIPDFNPFKSESTVKSFSNYKSRISVTILDL